jgi:hypothetical protein
MTRQRKHKEEMYTPPINNHGARTGRLPAKSNGRFNPGKAPVPIVQEARWAPGPL